MKKIIIVSVFVLLAGCATPTVKYSSPRSVMLGHVSHYNTIEALKLAEDECMKHNRHAVHVPDNIRDGQASYECKD